jgi:hypothetical protein
VHADATADLRAGRYRVQIILLDPPRSPEEALGIMRALLDVCALFYGLGDYDADDDQD